MNKARKNTSARINVDLNEDLQRMVELIRKFHGVTSRTEAVRIAITIVARAVSGEPDAIRFLQLGGDADVHPRNAASKPARDGEKSGASL